MKDMIPQLYLSMKHYTKEQFVKDVISGVIVAIIALPLSIALALASGVTPEQGLYTAIVAGFIRRKQSTDCRANGSICLYCSRYCYEKRI
jgi:MFS superfamily sulfate permease-like transporter